MKYQINLENTHCSGCFGLIKLFLEETFGENSITIDAQQKIAFIQTSMNAEETQNSIKDKFKEMHSLGKNYTFSKFQIIS